jgi:hypothetical protein
MPPQMPQNVPAKNAKILCGHVDKLFALTRDNFTESIPQVCAGPDAEASGLTELLPTKVAS